MAGATADEREHSLSDELELLLVGARPVEPAVAQHRAASAHDHVLEVVDCPGPLDHLERIVLGLDPSSLADPSCASNPNLPALVVVAVTSWPRATSCGTRRRPMTPVPPATNTRMTITFLITLSLALRHRRPAVCDMER
jgi:hypothetical protein